jgi:hypothetical protein
MGKNICVFCSSSDYINPKYLDLAREVGEYLAKNGHILVWGGGKVGMMGVVARAVHAHGGKMIGVIPDFLRDREIAYEQADELVITSDLFDRKKKMLERSDAYLILPGGFGTLDEWLEVLTLKQLRQHRAPIVVLNYEGFFDEVLAFFKRICDQGFAPLEHGYFEVVETVDDLGSFF